MLVYCISKIVIKTYMCKLIEGPVMFLRTQNEGLQVLLEIPIACTEHLHLCYPKSRHKLVYCLGIHFQTRWYRHQDTEPQYNGRDLETIRKRQGTVQVHLQCNNKWYQLEYILLYNILCNYIIISINSSQELQSVLG